MNITKYLDMYLEEGRSHVATIRAGLNTSDGALSADINELFRQAHSLKGMAASMGFTPTSSLAHGLESLFAVWRDGTTPSDDQIKTAVEAVDLLDAMLDDVQQNGNDSALAERASSVERNIGQGDGNATPAPSKWSLETREEKTGRERTSPPAEVPGMKLKVYVDPASPLPAARFLVVSKKLKSGFGEVTMAPELAEIQRGNLYTAIFSLPAGSKAKEAAHAIESLPEISRVELLETEPVRRTAGGKHSLVRSVRVSIDDLDLLLNQTGDLIYNLNIFESGLPSDEKRRFRFWLENYRSRLNRQFEQVLSARLVPFQVLVDRVGRTIRQLSSAMAKEVRFEYEGADQRVDGTLLEKLLDPLLHLTRNAIDHGLESAEERISAGKPESGLIRLEIRPEADAILVILSDDGRGMDVPAIRREAVERGLYTQTQAARLDEAQLLNLLTTPAFSTRKEVTEVSGRGVGLDVVRSAVESLSGHLNMESTSGKGSTFTLVIPSAVTLTDILVFGWEGVEARFGIPNSQIRHIHPLSNHQLTWVGEKRCLKNGEELLPVVPWKPGPVGKDGYGLEFASGEGRRVLLVSSVYQTEKVMILPWGPPLEMVPGWMGGALLATGDLAFVLDARVISKRIGEVADVQ